MRLRVIGLMTVLVASSVMCRPSGSPLSEHPPTPSTPTEIPTPSLYPTHSSVALPSNCPHMPLGGFHDVWRNEQVWPHLGCAVTPAKAVTGTEVYLCDGRHSLWLREERLFVTVRGSGLSWAFVADESGLPPDVPLMIAPTPQLPKPTPGPPTVTPVPTPTQVVPLARPTATPTPSPHSTQLSALPSSESGLLPDASLMETPIARWPPGWPLGCFPATGRHGWLARATAGAEKRGGWSQTSETTFNGAMQQFEGGWLLWNGNVCFVLFADGRWTMF